MKVLLLALISFSVSANEARYFKVTNEVVGYECPDGYYYNSVESLCYPKRKVDAPEVSEKHISNNADKNTINIYNYNGATKLDMPKMDIVGIKRRKKLDKDALMKLLDGDFYQEESTESVDIDEE